MTAPAKPDPAEQWRVLKTRPDGYVVMVNGLGQWKVVPVGLKM